MKTNKCKSCHRFVKTENVKFEDGKLLLVLPNLNYELNDKYCIIVAQKIPDNTTVKSKVFVVTSDSVFPILYSFGNRIVDASSIRSRHKYAVEYICNESDKIHGTVVFKLLGKTFCDNPSINKDD